jgi:hypothetical protein
MTQYTVHAQLGGVNTTYRVTALNQNAAIAVVRDILAGPSQEDYVFRAYPAQKPFGATLPDDLVGISSTGN